jgi:outer membrane protein TolC
MKKSAFVLLLSLLAGTARAGMISWEDCVREALRRNPDVAAARELRDAGRQDYKGSFNAFMPQAVLSHGYADSNLATGSARWNTKASASMALFDMNRAASIRGFSASLSRAEAQLRQASADLRLNLRQAFVQTLFSQENIGVATSVVGIRERGAQMVSLRYQAGREFKGNMLRAQAQLLQAQSEAAQAGRDLRAALSVLGRELGEDEWKTLVATGSLAAAPAPETPDAAEPFVSRRPEVAEQEAAVAGAEAALSAAQSPIWPTLSASYARTASGPVELPHESLGWAFAGTLSLPVFGGGPTATYHAREAAKSRLESARETLRLTRAQVLADIENAWANYAQASSGLIVQGKLLESARQRGDEADIRYTSGLLTYDNWEIINTDRVNQERQILQARLNVALAEAAWERALGEALGE